MTNVECRIPNATKLSQYLLTLVNASQQRCADRAVQPRTAKGVLQLLTQHSQRAVAGLSAHKQATAVGRN